MTVSRAVSRFKSYFASRASRVSRLFPKRVSPVSMLLRELTGSTGQFVRLLQSIHSGVSLKRQGEISGAQLIQPVPSGVTVVSSLS